MQPYFVLYALFLSLPLFGQHNLYYTKIGESTDSAGATYRHEITNLPNGWTYIKEYRPINTLYSEGAYSVYKKTKKQEEGIHKTYRADGVLWYTESYEDGKSHGEFRSYYPGSQLKRIERYEKGTFVSGECFQEDGSPRPFTRFQQAPQYPGGEQALFNYISTNLQYPPKARKKNIQGRVVLTFVLNKDGSVSDVQVVKGIGGGCDEEAVRLVSEMPRWQPGLIDDDQPVKVKYTLPLRFRLD